MIRQSSGPHGLPRVLLPVAVIAAGGVVASGCSSSGSKQPPKTICDRSQAVLQTATGENDPQLNPARGLIVSFTNVATISRSAGGCRARISYTVFGGRSVLAADLTARSGTGPFVHGTPSRVASPGTRQWDGSFDVPLTDGTTVRLTVQALSFQYEGDPATPLSGPGARAGLQLVPAPTG